MINRFAECLQNRRVALHARAKEREKGNLGWRNNSIASGLKKYHVRRE
ncbi:hypothetical protein ALC62_05748 [Cyphomyrmex costatus]|uniref:Uncharacterized protein n=1 Tax=Cyphomyrmex costatus TaxID=456900 RepID=A0A195CRM2_9HYME|nr:hypothetical protein ALC62_05748 [Cyphomyrmex costatus]